MKENRTVQSTHMQVDIVQNKQYTTVVLWSARQSLKNLTNSNVGIRHFGEGRTLRQIWSTNNRKQCPDHEKHLFSNLKTENCYGSFALWKLLCNVNFLLQTFWRTLKQLFFSHVCPFFAKKIITHFHLTLTAMYKMFKVTCIRLDTVSRVHWFF